MLISQFGSGDRERQRRSHQDPAIGSRRHYKGLARRVSSRSYATNTEASKSRGGNWSPDVARPKLVDLSSLKKRVRSTPGSCR
jgi:hypothetical protein